jgi:hypothetical protein
MRSVAFDEARFDAACGRFGEAYRAALQRAVIERDDGQVVLDWTSAGWREAQRIAQAAGNHADAAEPRPMRGKGVGDHLHDLIVERFGVAAKGGSGGSGGCGCGAMIRTLNVWGPRKCAERIDEIVGHLLGQSEHLSRWYRWALRLPGGRRLAAHEARALIEQAIARCQPRSA